MSSMTPSGPHSFSATVPGGATCAPGGTQPAANAKMTADSANKATRCAAWVIAGVDIRLRGRESSNAPCVARALSIAQQKNLFSAHAHGVCLLRFDGLRPAKDGLTMTQALFALVVLAMGPAIPPAAAQGGGGTSGTKAAPPAAAPAPAGPVPTPAPAPSPAAPAPAPAPAAKA